MKPYRTLLFYKYVKIEEAELFAAKHLAFCKPIDIKGRILIADEGINGTASGTVEACERYIHELRSDERFADMEYKIDDEDTPSFSKIFVRYKKEIVHFGQKEIDVWKLKGRYLEPDEWLKMMEEDDVVILDVRNKVEWELGKFKNAVTLDIDHFRDMPEKISEIENLKDKKILAYCTGGIRCEKATAYLLQQGFKNVFHLHGGIIRYGKETGGKDFDGKCYVFDERIGVDVNSINPTVISKCRICGTQSTRMVNCANVECNEHFAMCEDCGWAMDGACSDACRTHPRKRPYNGTGYYVRGKEQSI